MGSGLVAQEWVAAGVAESGVWSMPGGGGGRDRKRLISTVQTILLGSIANLWHTLPLQKCL